MPISTEKRKETHRQQKIYLTYEESEVLEGLAAKLRTTKTEVFRIALEELARRLEKELPSSFFLETEQ